MHEKAFRIERDIRRIEDKVKEGFVYVDPHITSENFRAPLPAGQNGGDATLVTFEDYVFSDEVLRRLEQRGLRAGLPTELVDLSRSYAGSRELASCLPLVALGDSWVGPLGNLLVVYLVGDAQGRELSLHWRDSGWTDDYWFMAFHN
jgi:hypothetical protein